MKRLLLIGVTAVALIGCQSTSNKIAGLCQIKSTIDTFTNSAKIDFTKCWVAASESVWDLPSYKFSFSWVESSPDFIRVGLLYESTVKSTGYTTFSSVLVNINGETTTFNDMSSTELSSSNYNTVTNTIYTASSAGFIIPFDYFEKMVMSDDVRIRVKTFDSYDDYIFSLESSGTMTYARADLPEYLSLINKYR